MINIAEIKNPYVMAAIAILKRQEPPSAGEIKEVVSKICNVSIAQIDCRRDRRFDVVLARHLCYKVYRESNYKVSLKDIGLAFNGYDHTSVIHGIRTITDRIETDDHVRGLYERVLNKLRINLQTN